MAERQVVIAPLVAALRDLATWLHDTQVPGIIIGGVAASLLGRPRVTRDVDALVIVDEREWELFLANGRTYGFIPRLSEPLTFARQARVLLLRHETSGIDIDIAFGALPFEEESISRSTWRTIGGVSLPLPTVEDLIIMKAIAHRPRDIVDIESLLDTHPKLDLRRVRRWVEEFATALDAPELLQDFNTLVTQRRKKRKPS